MLSHFASQFSQLKSRIQDRGVIVGPRRESHNGQWVHEPARERRQPQDGAPHARVEMQPRVASMNAYYDRVLQMEPEDARLTGGTRSLMRRLLGLNILQPAAEPQAAMNAKSVAIVSVKLGKKKMATPKVPQRLLAAPEQAA